jgi:hypothetical protein
MLRTAGILIALASLVVGCAPAGTGTGTLSAADRCAQEGGLWRPALAMCERAAAGGGGY